MHMGTRTPTDADRTAALDKVIEVAILLSADMDQALAADGLTPARVRLVWELGRRGPSTQRDLAAALDVTARNITGLVDALTESGHVTRERHPTDRRATLVTFTDRGEAVVRKLQDGPRRARRAAVRGHAGRDVPRPQRGARVRGHHPARAGHAADRRAVMTAARRLLPDDPLRDRLRGGALSQRGALGDPAVRRTPGATPHPYVGAVSVLLWAFIGGSTVELVALHLILPWETVRLVADVLGVWGLVWMIGLAGSYRVFPHLVTDEGVRVRNGHTTDLLVPWDAIASVRTREHSAPSSRAVQLDPATRTLSVVVAGRTNVELVLGRPFTVPVKGVEEEVLEVRLFADEHRDLLREVRARLDSAGQPVK